MLIDEEFKTIYLNYKIKEIIPFLKELTPKDKKEIAATLKKHINKEWGHNTISVLAALACSKTKDEYEKMRTGFYSIPVELVDELFETDVPDWIGGSHQFLDGFDYLKVLEWEQKGYLTLNDDMWASMLSSSSRKEETLFSYPVTLESHIWFLFEHECNITSIYRDRNWKDILKNLVQENKINRSRVLKASLAAINFNFSKEHNTWFLELFAYLEPTPKEILALQDELFMIFHSTQHSLFPGLLKIISPVITEKDFKTEDFLRATASLMTLPTKNIINALLQVLEKIAKDNKKYHEAACLFLMPVFLNKDKTLQTKAAKIIAKYGDPKSGKVREELTFYTASLLSDAQVLLDKFFVESEVIVNKEEQSFEARPWHISQPIASIETIDDFIFLASQVFNNNETYHLGLFLDALIKFNTAFDDEHFNKLEPVFNVAFKRKDTTGFQHLLATFVINYGLLKQKNKLKVLSDAYLGFPALENWSEKRTPFIFKAYQQLLLGVFEFLKENKHLPLLSVPEYTPCWITITTLVDKLKIYQQQGDKPIPFDLEIAWLRVEKINLEKGKQYAKEQLNEEYFDLLKPVFEQNYFKDHYEKEFLDGSFDWKLGYKKIYKWNSTEEIPQSLISIENNTELPENASFLDHLFNSYHTIYQDDLIRTLYTAPYFSGSLAARKYNGDLSCSTYQYDIKGNIKFLDAWMKLNLPFQPAHYLVLSAGLFHKDKTFSGIAFEALINKTVSEDFNIQELGIIIGKKINFEWAPVKRFTDGLSGFINLSTSHNHAFEKLLISILTAVEKPVFNLKKLLELYYELLNQNRTRIDEKVAEVLKEWENENNLKKIIHQIKTHERKTL
ncbi:hypothetical protein BBH99_11035 [Chryseobacterium contaminans]|uniref:Uncharacterized protein n=1 Tax=Chryseobacterium contaminans TaxID=1423959 RepID=A0A1M7F8S4_9FLAO|nr:DUF6493 family protein [Chryseobacterium contaminans]OCA77804.1 hypothetical protein BBH99_11035 [Chryseobacterium contaminans]SHM00464.1 hypothetical protein SAMN05444407_108140 [Chryseobacterium contaminans]